MLNDIGTTLHLTLWCVISPLVFTMMGAMVWWFSHEQEKQQTDRVSEIWQQRDIWGEDICRALLEGHIKPGMSKAMVELAWGSPTLVNPDDTSEQWVYEGDRVIQFSEEIVISVTGHSSHRLNSGMSYTPIFIGMGVFVGIITIVIFVIILLFRSVA